MNFLLFYPLPAPLVWFGIVFGYVITAMLEAL